MSETTPHRPRHALVDESGEPAEPAVMDGSDAVTTALPSGHALFTAALSPSSGAAESWGAPEEPARPDGGDYTDDATVLLPIIPLQRAGSFDGPAVPAPGPPATVPPFPTGRTGPGHPGPPPAPAADPEAGTAVPPRRRMRPAVLAAATALVLVAGVAVGVGTTDLSDPSAPTATP